ncbi:MAG: K(+)-transporting ATPase subunit F [Alphaproteobacteria bacterium]|nr:K(+)-transporting ATPase subunit F [Alphaproteobacteria bacterium]
MLDLIVGAVVAAGLGAYCLYALLNPDKF